MSARPLAAPPLVAALAPALAFSVPAAAQGADARPVAYVNPDRGKDTDNPNVADSSECESPVQSDTQPLGDEASGKGNVHVDACLFDAAGTRVDTQAAFTVSGVGTIAGCPDPDKDGPQTSTKTGNTCVLYAGSPGPSAAPPAAQAVEPATRPPAATAAPPAVVPATGPLRLTVPALGVDATALELGIEPDGTLQVPATAHDVGWYAGSALPGDIGPAVFAGHVDLDGRPGVFVDLSRLAPGDPVTVTRPDGAVLRFVVSRVEQHGKDAFPTERVYGPTSAPELRLVTCGGAFDRRKGSYLDNVVVFTEPAGSTPG